MFPDVPGCEVPQGLFERWSSLLVAEHAPFFVTEGARSLLPDGAVCLTRAEFNQTSPSLELRDSYRTYDVKPEGAFVTLLSHAEFRSLPLGAQRALLRLQWELGRGQVYDREWVRRVLPTAERAVVDEPSVFDTPEGEKLALDHAVWWGLSPEARRRWLVAFISEDQPPDPSAPPRLGWWDRIERRHGPAVRALAGTFPRSSGPNCFSTTLAAATPSLPTALSVAALWLHQEPFLRGLAERGYAPDDSLTERDPLPPGAVLVWAGRDGSLRHACYVVDGELALNKDSQAWFVPRRLAPVRAVLDDWREEGSAVRVYVRGSTGS